MANTQISRWIDESPGPLYLASDGSTTQHHGESIIAIGLVNSQNQFCSIRNSIQVGKDAAAQAETTMGALPTSCLSAIEGFIGDSARLQMAASKLVSRAINELNETEKEHVFLTCGLHTGASCGRKGTEAMSPEHKQFHRDLKLILSKRINEGYRRESLKEQLEDRLVHFNRKVSGVSFKSDLGSRAGSEAENGIALITYRADVDAVLDSMVKKIENENEGKRTKSRQQQLQRLKRVQNYLNPDNWPETMIFLGSHILLWHGLARRIWKIENHKRSVTEKKEDINRCIARYEKVLNENDAGEPYEKLIAVTIQADLLSVQKECIDQCGMEYLRATGNIKKKVNDYIRFSCNRALEKLKKDTLAYTQLPDSNDLIISTNRNCESVFGCYKSYEHQFPSMSKEMIEILTRCSLNKVIILIKFDQLKT